MGDPNPDGRIARSDARNVVRTVTGNAVQIGSLTGDLVVHQPGGSFDRPRQVPPTPRGFVDRETILSTLDKLLLGGSSAPRQFVVISGLAGVGKTAVVRRWVHEWAERFSGGQFYVDYAAVRTDSGAPVNDALADCLLALGVQHEHIPATLSSRANLFRTMTATAPVLVVLDDVTEPAQVPPFLPNSNGSVVLVTSSDRLSELALDGAHLLVLEPLDERSGLALLRELCGPARVLAEAQVATKLVGFCAGLPVALRIVAARLMSRPQLTIACLAGELADETTRLAAFSLRGEPLVSAVFDNAYRTLPAEAAALYRGLGIAPMRKVSVEVASVVLDLPLARAKRSLDVLVDASFLDELPGNGFTMHDLVRLHARERSMDEDSAERRESVLDRIRTHYLRKSAFADRAVMGKRMRIADLGHLLEGEPDPFPGEAGKAAALEWLCDERGNLLAVLHALADQGWDDSAWQLCESLHALYLNRRFLDDWVEASEIGAAAADRAGNAAAEARLLSVVSRAYTELGELDLARTRLERALVLAERSEHTVLIASVWEFTGRYRDRVDPGSSAEAYQRAIERNTEAGERRGVALATYFLGCAISSGGDQTAALEVLQRAHRLLLEVNDVRMAGRGSISLGVAHFRSGDSAAARRELERAVGVFTSSKAAHYEAEAREALAEVAEHEGDLRSARENLTRVLHIRRASGAPNLEGLVAHLQRLTV
ncbi:NB-ARC domain-containing protein [Lentzea sp. NBRC 102530]|uniref:NB-ARC domain-containing protein n=1 Tax=Lentzea sp. NBRC 102530 TaxID=3032201 RepID=UPI0024A17D3B|nr:NB-ARC domain-containing protein [Lentzea sp. NBRC 102530]GLY49555.1 NTPase [Lentzea sp. NBRC 102530]